MDTTNPIAAAAPVSLAARRPRGGPWLFDISPLLHWYTYHDHVTGITRVVERLVTAPAFAADPGVRFVCRVEGMKGFAEIAKAPVVALARPGERAAALAHLRGAFAELERRRRRARGWRRRFFAPAAAAAIGRGDTLVNLAEFWAFDDQDAAYREIKAATGPAFVQFIYDIIPETHPHLCYDDHNERFRRTLGTIADIADGFLCGSRYVEGDLKRYLARRGAPARPTAVIPFGWDFAEPEGSGDALAALGLAPGRYILQVGTLEPRKNHLMVVRALQALYGKLGARLPIAVFAGRLGWKTDALLNELTAIDNLGGRIRLVHKATDADLAALYRGCRFSVFPSFAEGWGLPVQESLFFGRPCLATHAASVPEVGGDLVEYVDPYDQPRFTAALERWIADDAHIAAMAARIAAHVARPPVRWDDSAEAVLDFLARLPART